VQFLHSVPQTMPLFQSRTANHDGNPWIAHQGGKAPRVLPFAKESTKEICMFMTLFVVLLVLWLLGFFAFHVAGGLIHLLLIIAVISLVMHFFRGRSAA
jgi:hypothetical protein